MTRVHKRRTGFAAPDVELDRRTISRHATNVDVIRTKKTIYLEQVHLREPNIHHACQLRR